MFIITLAIIVCNVIFQNNSVVKVIKVIVLTIIFTQFSGKLQILAD